ncbi:putative membrane protein [Chryseobacterium defluvii]|uniref:Putative membrane protein n=1 Tax=Chryseobacterium defluvii TaxID=160396 RepID=A0A840KKS7_9FLAO|nr:thioredoxin domain-containing protein [Chryseobacterium defluvii]MBB4808244.1 putative membrane protein [Chryseobacterium defluvii]
MTFDKLISYLKLDKQEFLFQFNSHPNYPSALAFSDTLNFMGVRNDAYELDKEYWDELPEEFIAIVENSFSLVKKSGNSYMIYSDKTKVLNKEELHRQSSDFVLLFEKDEKSDHKPVVGFKPFLYTVFVIMLIYSAFYLTWYEAAFNLLSLIGVYISLEIFNQKFGNVSTVIGSICRDTSAQQNLNSCDKIIIQDKTSFFGLKFSDLSLIYFAGIAVLGLFLPATAFIIKGFTLASVMAIGYSLYIQAFVEKMFCRICLLIIAILAVQLLICFRFFESLIFNTAVFLLTIILWLIAFSTVLSLNHLLEEKESFKKSNAKNLRFKRNYELFKRELLDKERIDFQDNHTFSLGNKEARLHIAVISNPYCGFCKGAHDILEGILKKYPDEVSVQIRFNYSPERADEKYTSLISNFMSIYKNKSGKDFLNAIDDWFENKNEDKISQLAGTYSAQEDLGPLVRITQENSNAGLNFTPVFIINGYLFPEKYDREDIWYFIDELLEDEEF